MFVPELPILNQTVAETGNSTTLAGNTLQHPWRSSDTGANLPFLLNMCFVLTDHILITLHKGYEACEGTAYQWCKRQQVQSNCWETPSRLGVLHQPLNCFVDVCLIFAGDAIYTNFSILQRLQMHRAVGDCLSWHIC